jgi:hypothetical protein
MNSSKEQIYRFNVSLPKGLMESVRTIAAVRRVSINSIIVDSLRTQLEGLDSKDVGHTILTEVGRVERRLKELSIDVESLGEVLGLYVLHWLCHLTPLTESEKRVASLEGRERFNRFIALVKERRISQRSVWKLLYDEPINDRDSKGEGKGGRARDPMNVEG